MVDGRTKTGKIVNQLKGNQAPIRPSTLETSYGGMYIPNHSGDHSAGRVLTTPTTDYEIANKLYVDTQNDLYVLKAGDTMTGQLTLDFNNVISNGMLKLDMTDSTSQILAPSIIFLHNSESKGIWYEGVTNSFHMNAALDMEDNNITGLADPTATQHAATKAYVDNVPYVSAYKTTSDQATTGSYADVTFNAELSKSGITHSTSTNTYEFEIDTAGIYEVTFETSITWGGSGSTGSVVDCKLQNDVGSGYVDIAGSFARDQTLNTTGSSGSMTIQVIKSFAVGDKIKAQTKDIGDSSNLKADYTRMVIKLLKKT